MIRILSDIIFIFLYLTGCCPEERRVKIHANEMLQNRIPGESCDLSVEPNLYWNTFGFLCSHSNALSLFILFITLLQLWMEKKVSHLNKTCCIFSTLFSFSMTSQLGYGKFYNIMLVFNIISFWKISQKTISRETEEACQRCSFFTTIMHLAFTQGSH